MITHPRPPDRPTAMRTVVFGNVGAGKSMLARALARHRQVPVLELEQLVRAPRPDPVWVRTALEAFCAAPGGWVVEGTAGHLIQATLAWQPELVFLNPGPVVCLRNCRERAVRERGGSPRRLDEQLQRVADYYRRDADEHSLRTHRAIFENYQGPKREFVHPVALTVANEIRPGWPVTRP